jgi:hypothetical protein
MNWLGLDGLQLLDPWFLLFAPAAVLAALWRARTPTAALPTAAAALFAGVRPSWRVRLRRLPLALSTLAACCLATCCRCANRASTSCSPSTPARR